MKYRQLFLSFIICHLSFCPAMAQTAQTVLDRCAATVTGGNGVTANFTMSSAQYGDATGIISIKGDKFYMQSSTSTMWFNGTTLWTYMASNDEVNISTPTAQQLQLLNPYHFVSLYRSGYNSTMTTSASAYTVHLTATDAQKKIREAFLTIDKTSYQPSVIKLLTGDKWTTFTVSGMHADQLSDARFTFNASAYPDAEIIDLR